MAIALCEETVISLLKETQGGRTNAEFAKDLGVHESYLSKVYHGEIPVGKKLLEGLARLRPEYAGELGLFLLGNLQTCRER